MSSSIDNKVVQMKFDNASFEKNIQTSLSSLSTLNKSLEMTESTKGLQGIGDAANKVDLSGLSGGIETLSMKFSALQVMAVTALANITNSALTAGKRMVSALTIDPIKTGLSEYETKINAIQVITANTMGKNTMSDITTALDELNSYADKTIYNFAEMTSNVGKFVAQGLNVQDATKAIEGMANLAAASGASAEDMSRATYQMSQALGGTIRKIDWNSLRNANMATTTLKETLEDLARVKGIDIDAMIKANGTFEDTLENGWLSGDLFTQAMNIYSGVYTDAELKAQGFNDTQIKKFQEIAKTASEAATQVKTVSQLWDVLKESAQSGWTQSWEYIIGDFDSAKKTLTEAQVYFGNMISASAKARNDVLKEWNDYGGRNIAINALVNAFNGLLSVIKPIKEAFQEIFPPITAAQLLELTKSVRNFTIGLTLSKETSEDVKSTFKGLFAVLDIVGQAFGAIIDAVFPLFGGLKDASGGVLSLTGSFGDFLVKLDETIRKTDFFKNIIGTVVDVMKTGFETIKVVIGVVLDKLSDFWDWAKQNFSFPGIEIFYALLQRVHDRMSEIMQSSETLRDALNDAFQAVASSAAFTTINVGLDKFIGFLQSLWEVVKIVGKGIADAMDNMASGVSGAIGGADFNSLFDFINGGLIAGLLVGINKFIFGFSKVIDNVGETISTFAEIKGAVLDTFGAFQQQLKAGTLLKIAGAIALLTASLVVLSMIDSDKLAVAMGAISTLFVELMGSMTIFSKIAGGSYKGMTTMAAAMLIMSVSILILAGAMKTLSTLDWEGVAKGMVSIAGLMTMLVITAKVLSSNSGKMMKGMTGLLIFTFAVKNLVSVVAELGSMDTDTLTKGLVGVGVLIGELSAFMIAAKFGKMGVGTGLGLMALAGAINILAISVQTFGAMDIASLVQGLGALEAVLLELTIFIQMNQGAKGMITTATGMVILGAAMLIFAKAVGEFGSMPLDTLVQGLGGMAIALAAVAISMNVMPKNMIGIGLGMIAVGTALLLIADAIIKIGGLSVEDLVKGVGGLVIALAGIAIAMNAMTGALPGAAAMLVMSAALAIFVPQMILLGSMSWESIGKGLATLAGAFIILGVAGLILGPLVPAILGLAGAFALIGLSVAAVGIGLMAIGVGLAAAAAGFSALAVLGTAGAVAVVAALTIIVEGIASMIPFVLTKIGEGIIAIAEVLIKATPVIVQAVVVIVTAVVAGLVALIPIVVDGIFQLLTALLETIVKFTPTIIAVALTIVILILEGIALALPSIIQAGVDIITAFLLGIASAAVQIADAGFQAIIMFLNGLADSIVTNTPLLMEAVNNLFNAIIEAAIYILTGGKVSFAESGKALMKEGLMSGITDKIDALKKVVGNVMSNALSAVSNTFEDFKSAGANIVNGLVNGIKDKFQDAVNAASDLGNKILDSAKSALGIQSPSKEFAEIGRYSDLGLIQGLQNYASGVYGAATDIGTGAIDAMKNSFNGISNVIDGNININPVITPILDLTNVTNGAKEISSMFNDQKLGVSNDSVQNGGTTASDGTISFVQNNYSPIALSRTEIYRQTKNQFSTLKGAISKA